MKKERKNNYVVGDCDCKCIFGKNRIVMRPMSLRQAKEKIEDYGKYDPRLDKIYKLVEVKR